MSVPKSRDATFATATACSVSSSWLDIVAEVPMQNRRALATQPIA
jgi:hypothetical protein